MAAVLLWSLAVVGTTIIIAQITRWLFCKTLTTTLYKVADEFLAFLQMSVCVLELGVVSNIYGFSSQVTLWACFIFMIVKHVTFIRGGYVGTPLSFVDFYYDADKTRTFSFIYALIIILAEFGGSLAAHPMVKILWGQTYSEYHNKAMFIECRTTLEVSSTYGFTVEVFTTFICWTTDLLTPFYWKPPVRSVISLGLAQIFMKTSGAWMNPVLATAHTYKCVGHGDLLEHLMVYWVGPFLGVLLARELNFKLGVLKDVDWKRWSKQTQKIIEPDIVPAGMKTKNLSTNNSLNSESLSDDEAILTTNIEKVILNSAKNKRNDRSPSGILRPRNQIKGPGQRHW